MQCNSCFNLTAAALFAGGGLLTAGSVADAAVISGVTIEDYSSNYGARNPQDTVNGAGLDTSATPPEHDNTPGNMWMSLNNDGIVISEDYLVFDLGEEHRVDGFRIWNYNEGYGEPANWTNRGIKDLEIFVSSTDNAVEGSTTPTPGATVTQLTDPSDSDTTFTFAEAPGTNGYQGVFIDVTDFTARYIRFDVSNNHADQTGDGFVGLSEVRFHAVPEPGSMSLLGLGGLALFSRGQRKRD